ncbi:unnamed protein product [Microthlaspi erraticum]|uniref:F-box domain-containing protein n=1 Tax=Microthlaspi erraticum TaxID=1685480 RepID=A0A6D2KX91_9BRAS|nr:unnamed protein product [Microthlaspi erraticum]
MKAPTKETGSEEGSNHEASPAKFPYLPQELITEILLRSHARSLGRFRCVSKPFLSLLSDPKFARNHLQNDAARSGQRILLLSKNYNLFAVEDFNSIGDGSEGTRVLTGVKLDYQEIRNNWVEIVGSSNGLVCICLDGKTLLLYNPTTREPKRVPDLPESLRFKTDKTWFSHGFGFDTVTNDYKVLKFVEGNNNFVYSLRTDSWRRIRNMPYKNVHFNYTVELNGAVNWINILLGGFQEQVMAFDLQTEEFRVMSLPDLTEECDPLYESSALSTLKGRLCVTRSCFMKHDVMWVMSEYGDERSWSKIRISVSYRFMIPVCSTKNDDDVVLLVADWFLVLYNFKCNTWSNLEICGLDLGEALQATTYVESLISPNLYGTKIFKNP